MEEEERDSNSGERERERGMQIVHSPPQQVYM